MKSFLFLIFSFSSLVPFAQIPKSGTYIYKFCDMEYNKCSGTCKLVIKGDQVTVYATRELEKQHIGYNEKDAIKKGIIVKDPSGKWVVAKNKERATPKESPEEPFPTLDFKKKQYWQL